MKLIQEINEEYSKGKRKKEIEVAMESLNKDMESSTNAGEKEMMNTELEELGKELDSLNESLALLEFGGDRGNTKKDKGKETKVIRAALKANGIPTQKITLYKNGKEVNRTAYSDKTKAGHSFKMYLGEVPDKAVQDKIKKDIIDGLPGAVVSFGPTSGGQYNYDKSPFIRVKVDGTQT